MRTISSRTGIADILFACMSLLFSLAALKGTLQLSPLGAGIDTDLQNYAQILEAARYPAAFAADPIARLFVHDPGVPNLIKRAVKPLPSGGGYKAPLAWQVCL